MDHLPTPRFIEFACPPHSGGAVAERMLLPPHSMRGTGMGERHWARCDASSPPLPRAGVLPGVIPHNLVHSLPAESLVDLLRSQLRR